MTVSAPQRVRLRASGTAAILICWRRSRDREPGPERAGPGYAGDGTAAVPNVKAQDTSPSPKFARSGRAGFVGPARVSGRGR